MNNDSKYAQRIIRANYNHEFITVYQAFNERIATAAVKAQTFTSPPFKLERMTWIKPSFLWMMYRSGWASKENQTHILSIKIKRKGVEWALTNSCLSHFNPNIYSSITEWKERLKESPVRVQWDPEKDIFLNNLPYRSIQIGLRGIAVEKYINDWIVSIEDITTFCKEIKTKIDHTQFEYALSKLPKEQPYAVPPKIAHKIGMSTS